MNSVNCLLGGEFLTWNKKNLQRGMEIGFTIFETDNTNIGSGSKLKLNQTNNTKLYLKSLHRFACQVKSSKQAFEFLAMQNWANLLIL